ncbi:MAG: glutamate--tRNA ligase [Patescibacteria group bacterium]|nr:glutamate--tRNA ligase [Patescibacteria group bacterium]
MTQIRVRMAPSPTGLLHMGTARTALFNILFAESQKGDFVLRVEDTDRTRSTKESEQNILRGLDWLGLMNNIEGIQTDGSEKGDFGPYRQTERLDRYNTYVEKLLESGAAYYCYMNEEELNQERAEQEAAGLPPRYTGKHRNLTENQKAEYEAEGRKPVIRFRVPENRILTYTDMIRGEISQDLSLIGDFVIIKSDGQPLYNIANVIDDNEMNISHVIRGEDHVPNTPKQILLYEALGLEIPKFGHMSLILNTDRSKMSKRSTDAADIFWLKEQGYLPEAIINMMALLGWNPGDGTTQEFFSLDQLKQLFKIERAHKAGAVFDIERLDYFNTHYIKQKSVQQLTDLCIPFLLKAGNIEQNRDEFVNPFTRETLDISTIETVVGHLQTKISKLKDITKEVNYVFRPEHEYRTELFLNEKMGITEESAKETLQWVSGVISNIQDMSYQGIKDTLVQEIKGAGYKNGQILWPLRYALTGEQFSMGAIEMIEILGKDQSIEKINKAIRFLSN